MSRVPPDQGRANRAGLRRAAIGLLVVGVAGIAAPAAAQQQDAKASYEKLCAACHGAGGHGDGPVASALNPRPVSFADKSVAVKGDEELAKVIADGKPPMPAFGKQLNASQIKAVVAYLRELSRKSK